MPFLGLDELDRCVENERVHVVVACEAARRFVHPLQLPAELAVPLALGTPRQLEATKQDPLPRSGLLGPQKSLLDPLALLGLVLGLLGSIRCQHLKLALGRPDRVLAFAHLASRFNLCPAQGSTELTCAYVGTTPGIEAEHGPERQSDQSGDLGAVERCGSRADDKQQHHRGCDENDRGDRLDSLRCVEIHGTPAERCPGHTHAPWFTAGKSSGYDPAAERQGPVNDCRVKQSPTGAALHARGAAERRLRLSAARPPEPRTPAALATPAAQAVADDQLSASQDGRSRGGRRPRRYPMPARRQTVRTPHRWGNWTTVSVGIRPGARGKGPWTCCRQPSWPSQELDMASSACWSLSCSCCSSSGWSDRGARPTCSQQRRPLTPQRPPQMTPLAAESPRLSTTVVVVVSAVD